MNQSLEQQAQILKDRLAALRGSRTEGIKGKIQTQVSHITQTPSLLTTHLTHTLELDSSWTPLDLVWKYGITEEICVTFWELLSDTKEDEFEKKDLLEALEKGMIVNLWMKDFQYFKILKICATEWWNDIFIVNFKYKSSKPARATFVLKFDFPLKTGKGMIIINPRTQQQLWKIRIIDSVSINTKTIIQKTLELFWF